MIQLKCPKCNVRLTLKKSLIADKGELIIACPNCDTKIRVKNKEKENLDVQKKFEQPKTSVFGLLAPTITYFLVHNETNEQFSINEPYMTFGRQASTGSADLQFETTDRSISRKHCVFRRYSDGVTIEDISKGGTIVNGKRLQQFEEKYLYESTTIQMGNEQFSIHITKK